MQSEVLAVQSNNTQDNPIVTTTDDVVEQTAEVDTTDNECKKTTFIKTVIGDLVAHLKPQKFTVY